MSDLNIEKRQTNKEKKEDIIYCSVEINNDYFQTTIKYKLVYNYYDQGGWILDENEIIDTTSKPLRGIDESFLNNVLESDKCHYSITQHTTDLDAKTDTIYFLGTGNHYTNYAMEEFTFDEEYGWISNSYEGKKHTNKIKPNIYDTKYDFSAAVGSFSIPKTSPAITAC